MSGLMSGFLMMMVGFYSSVDYFSFAVLVHRQPRNHNDCKIDLKHCIMHAKPIVGDDTL